MDPDGGWRYHDPTSGAHGYHGHHHTGRPVDDGGSDWMFLPPLLPLLMVLWVIYRWYALDLSPAGSVVRAARAARHDTVRRAGTRRRPARRDRPGLRSVRCDPAAGWHRPALADVNEAATARFVDASPRRRPGHRSYPGRGPASASWSRPNARNVHGAPPSTPRLACRRRFTPGERALVDQVVARAVPARSSPHEAERRTAYGRCPPPAGRPGAAHGLGDARPRRNCSPPEPRHARPAA